MPSEDSVETEEYDDELEQDDSDHPEEESELEVLDPDLKVPGRRGRHPASSESRKRAIELGQKIKKARLRRGVSQRQLSINAEVPQSTISRLERGVAAGVTIDTILRISRSLNQPTDVLLGAMTTSEVMRAIDPVPSQETWLFAMQCRSNASVRDLSRLLLRDIRQAEKRIVGLGIEMRRTADDIDVAFYSHLNGNELVGSVISNQAMLSAMHFQSSGPQRLGQDFIGGSRSINVLPDPTSALVSVGLHATVYVTFSTEIVPQDTTIKQSLEDILEVSEVISSNLTDTTTRGGYPSDAVNAILSSIVDLNEGLVAITDDNGRILFASDDLESMAGTNIDNAFDQDEVGDISSIGRRAVHMRTAIRKPNVPMRDGRVVNVSVSGVTTANDQSYAVWLLSSDEPDNSRAARQAQDALSSISFIAGMSLDGVGGTTLRNAIAEQLTKTLKADRVIIGRFGKDKKVELSNCSAYRRENWAVMRERISEDVFGHMKTINDLMENGSEIYAGDVYGIPLRFKGETVGFVVVINPEQDARVFELMNPVALAMAMQ